MKFIFALLTMAMLPAYAGVIQLESGNFIVNPKDRYGNIQTCTFEVQNVQPENHLIVNMKDCPPELIDVKLTNREGEDFYASEKIEATTSSRGGFKVYKIQPLSPKEFKMTSFREYADGEAEKPRSIIGKKR